MLTNLQSSSNIQANTSLLNKISDKKNRPAAIVREEENIKQLKENKNLPDAYAQLPHHCIQLCFLS